MRELKFRAWDKETRTMYYDVICRSATWNAILSHGGIGMQYTGRKDKNKKDIYEGDIVRLFDAQSGIRLTKNGSEPLPTYVDIVAVWSEPDCGWRAKYLNRGNLFCMGSRIVWAGMIKEVIGNIYEDPELLNEEENNE